MPSARDNSAAVGLHRGSDGSGSGAHDAAQGPDPRDQGRASVSGQRDRLRGVAAGRQPDRAGGELGGLVPGRLAGLRRVLPIRARPFLPRSIQILQWPSIRMWYRVVLPSLALRQIQTARQYRESLMTPIKSGPDAHS